MANLAENRCVQQKRTMPDKIARTGRLKYIYSYNLIKRKVLRFETY